VIAAAGATHEWQERAYPGNADRQCGRFFVDKPPRRMYFYEYRRAL